MAQVRTAALRLLAGGLVVLLAAGCSELSPPQPTLDVQVSPQSEVQVDAAGTYTVGNLVVRGTNFPANTTASVSLVSPPEGVALVSPLTLPISSTPTTQELKLSLNPSPIFSQGETQKNLSLTLRLAVSGMEPVTRPFALTLRRSGGGGGGGSGVVPSLALTLAQNTLSLRPGESGSLMVFVSASGLSGQVALDVSGLPDGVKATLPEPFAVDAPIVSKTLSFTVAPSVAEGTYPLTVKAKAVNRPTVQDAAPLNLVLAPRPGLTTSVSLTRLGVFPGETLSGRVTVTSQGGLSGTVVVQVSACSYPISYVPYGTLVPNGTLPVDFTITVPDNAPTGLCQVQATATLNEHTATGQAQFDVLTRAEVQVTVSPSQAIAGTIAIPVGLSIRLVGTWSGLATLQIFDGDLKPLTSSSAPTYEVRGVHTSPVVPDPSGYAYFPLSGSVEGLLVLTMPGGWAEGEYPYYLLLDGPNRVSVPFTVKVLPKP